MVLGPTYKNQDSARNFVAESQKRQLQVSLASCHFLMDRSADKRRVENRDSLLQTRRFLSSTSGVCVVSVCNCMKKGRRKEG